MKILPKSPNLEFLRREAKLLKTKHSNKDSSVVSLIAHFDTSMHGLKSSEIFARKMSIIDAQRIVARQYSFSSWTRLKRFVEHSHAAQYFRVEATLAQDIIKRNKHTDELIKNCRSTKNNHEAVEAFYAYGLENANYLNTIYEQLGWPGPEQIGREGSDACFMLAASATLNASFQARTALLLHEAVEEGKAFGSYYACLIDRYLALSNKKTIYGSMSDIDSEGRLELSGNVIDPENLDKRRALVGYEPFEKSKEYLRELNEGKNPDPEQWREVRNDIATRGGYLC